MTRIECSVVLPASPQQVTSILLDAELAPRWTAGLQRIEVVSGVVGEPGCVGHAHYREGGREYVLVDVLQDAVAGCYYRSHIEGSGISVDVETTLEPLAEGATLLTLRWSGMGTRLLTKPILPLMRRRIAARAEADLQALALLTQELLDDD